jgi:hypothetical protein
MHLHVVFGIVPDWRSLGEPMAFGSRMFALLKADHYGDRFIIALHCTVLGTSWRTAASGSGIDQVR